MNIYRGWEIYPKGIYDFGMKMREEYPDLKFFISENGMGVEHEERFRGENGEIQDDYRIEFVKRAFGMDYEGNQRWSAVYGVSLLGSDRQLVLEQCF